MPSLQSLTESFKKSSFCKAMIGLGAAALVGCSQDDTATNQSKQVAPPSAAKVEQLNEQLINYAANHPGKALQQAYNMITTAATAVTVPLPPSKTAPLPVAGLGNTHTAIERLPAVPQPAAVDPFQSKYLACLEDMTGTKDRDHITVKDPATQAEITANVTKLKTCMQKP